jgi:PST family polysaccharide transporter
MLHLRRAPFAWPRLKSLKPAMLLSSDVLVSRLCWYAYSNADFLVAGRVLGKAALGFYEFGWTLANLPAEKVTALIGQVTPGFFSAVQTDFATMRRYLLGITEGIALITFPISLGLVLVAKDFVLVVLGSKWEGSIAPLQLLAAYAGFRSLTPLLPQVLTSIKDSRFVLWNTVASVLLMPASFYIGGSLWGTVGLAMVWVLVYPVIASMLYWRVFRKIEMSPRAYVVALWPGLSGTALMSAVVLALGWFSGPGWSPAFRLATEIGAGLITYGLACLLLHRERFKLFYRLVTAAR